MTSMKIYILNPKAARLLKDLANLNVIAIQDTSKNWFASVLKKLRSKVKLAPILEEITKEIEVDKSQAVCELNEAESSLTPTGISIMCIFCTFEACFIDEK